MIVLKPIQWKKLLLSLAVPLGVGGLSAFFTRDSMERFAQLRQPPLSPPGWAFPVVWTILFLLMGLACYRVLRGNAPTALRRRALWVYGLQLVFNFCWSLLFFNLGAHLLAFFWLLILWVLILINYRLFSQLDQSAGLLLLPYLAWVTFAGYLNFGIWLLNK